MSELRPSLTVLGMMTGTSCDGLDASCIRVDTQGWEPLWSASVAYPPQLRKAVLELQSPGSKHSLRQILKTHAQLGEWYGQTALKFLKDKKKMPPQIIANHGQTVAHFPEDSPPTTLQLGDPARISAITGLTVAYGFRYGDVAVGGQGAPLVPLFHQSISGVLDDTRQGIAVHNIGGISNLTYIPPDERSMIAFDTGPGNVWIDAATVTATRGKQTFDRNGALAKKGTVDQKALRKLLAHPYFRKAPPKSTGRDDFPIEIFLKACKKKGADLVATATAVTIESIALAYENQILKRKLPLHRIFVCGGGAKNTTLIQGLAARMPNIHFSALDQSGLDPQLIESQAFAYFGFLSLMGRPLGGPWTGAKRFGPPAQLIPGENWLSIVRSISHMT